MTDTTLGCCKREHTRASLTNISAKAGLSEKPGNTRLMATVRAKPSAPTIWARNTSAMPPPPRRATSW